MIVGTGDIPSSYSFIKEERNSLHGRTVSPPVIRWLANTVVFPFSKSGDVKVYSEQELRRIFEAAGFRDIETYIRGTVLFFSAKKMQVAPEGCV